MNVHSFARWCQLPWRIATSEAAIGFLEIGKPETRIPGVTNGAFVTADRAPSLPVVNGPTASEAA
jgi:hypothetical protein